MIDELLGPEGPEVSCEECFERLDEYVELELAGEDAEALVGPGRLVAGLHTEEVIHDIVDPDAVQRDTAGEYVELVAERLVHRLPRLEDMRLGDVWAGIYPRDSGRRPRRLGPQRSHPGAPDARGGLFG